MGFVRVSSLISIQTCKYLGSYGTDLNLFVSGDSYGAKAGLGYFPCL